MDPLGQMSSAGELLAQRVMERVVDLVVQALDVNELAQKADVDRLLGRVDVNALLRRVDVDALLRQVDVDALLGQVDVDALLGQVDVNALLDRVDVNRLIDRVDVDSIVQHTDIGSVLALSSGNVASGAVDALRGQAVAADQWIDRVISRLLRRKAGGLAGPPALSAAAEAET